MNKDSNIACFDGVRGAACLLVVFHHASVMGFAPALSERSLFSPYLGVMAVMVFFTLSGFLMAYHYLPGKVQLRYWLAFTVRRLLRIYPAFIAVSFFLWKLHSPHILVSQMDLAQMKHLWLMLDDVEIFWTIRIEMMFYLCLPFAALLVLAAAQRPPAIIVWIFLWLAASYAPRVTVLYDWLQNHTVLFNLLTCSVYFMSGIIAGLLYREPTRLSPKTWNAAALATLGLLFVMSCNRPFLPDLQAMIWRYPYLCALVTGAMLLAVARSGGVVKQLFANRLLRWFGTISYGLYLTHLYTFTLIRYRCPPAGPATYMLAFATVFAAGALVYYLIEQPGNRLGKQLSARILHE